MAPLSCVVVKCTAPLDNLIDFLRSQVLGTSELGGCQLHRISEQPCGFAPPKPRGCQLRCTSAHPYCFDSQTNALHLLTAWLSRAPHLLTTFWPSFAVRCSVPLNCVVVKCVALLNKLVAYCCKTRLWHAWLYIHIVHMVRMVVRPLCCMHRMHRRLVRFPLRSQM